MRFFMRILSVSLLASLFGCAQGAASLRPDLPEPLPAATEADRERVAALRLEVEASLRSQALQLWERWTDGAVGGASRGEALGAGLGDPDTILAVRRVLASSVDPEERRALRLLETFLIGELIAAKTSGVDRKIRDIKSNAVFESSGEEHHLDELGQLLAREADPSRRVQLARASLPVIRMVAEEQEERDRILLEVSRSLDHASFGGLAARMVAGDVDTLAALAERFLDETEELFRRSFGEAARRELGLPLEELRRSDLPRLFRGVTFEVRFPADEVRQAAIGTFEGIGLGLGAPEPGPGQGAPASAAPTATAPARLEGHAGIALAAPTPAVEIDDEDRPNKDPRPACFPVDPPSDVRLSVPAGWAAKDWRPLLRAVGCAAQMSRLQEGGPWELRALGPAASSAAFGFLHESLAEDPAWLREHTRKTQAEIDAQLAGAALQQLFVARRAAARLLFERQRFSQRLAGEELDEAYRQAVERAFLFPLDAPGAARFLDHRNEPFGAAALFQARLLAAALEAHLQQRHGPAWWHDPSAGETLGAIFSQGIFRDPAEIAELLGEDGLAIDPLITRLSPRLAPLHAPVAPPPPEEPIESPDPEATKPPALSSRWR